MALTLNGGINATTRDIRVSGTVPETVMAGYLFRVDDEVMEFQTFRRQWPSPTDTALWRVRRGIGTSVAASHSNGASIFGATDAWASGSDPAAPSPFPGGGLAVPINLTGTADPAAKWTDPIDSRGGKSLALFHEVSNAGDTDGINTFVATRVLGKPFCLIPAQELWPDSEGGMPIWTTGTTWGAIPPFQTYITMWNAILDETVVAVVPSNGNEGEAFLEFVFLTHEAFYVGPVGDPPASGTFHLTWGGQETAALPFDCSADDIVAALAALPGIGAGNIAAFDAGNDQDTSDDNFAGTYPSLYFCGALGEAVQALPTVTNSTLDESIEVVELDIGGASGVIGSVTFFVREAFGTSVLAEWANEFAIEIIEPGTPNAAYAVTSEDGYTAQINLATDANGAPKAATTFVVGLAADFVPFDANTMTAPLPTYPLAVTVTDGTGPNAQPLVARARAATHMADGGPGGATPTYTVKGSL